MTEQELQELKEILSKGTPTQWALFNKVVAMRDDVERLRKELAEWESGERYIEIIEED